MIRIADLFAGIGGVRLGFQQAGQSFAQPIETQCVFTSEIDKFCHITYQANFLEEKIWGDISKVKSDDIPDHDILLAGFPCQPFSQAGLKKGFDDTRGTLYFEIERILKAKQPRAVLLENVKRLKTHDNGKTMRVIMSSLESSGYKTIEYSVLRARDFGVPQNRQRIYIVAFKEFVPFSFPKPLNIPTSLGDILETDVDDRYTISDRLWAGHQKRKIQNRLKGKGFGYTLFNEASPYANTITKRYYKDGAEILIEQKGKNPRKLTRRECARLQGFPESYHLPENVSTAQIYRQFGNSVSVPVIRAIAKQMLVHLQKPTHRDNNLQYQVIPHQERGADYDQLRLLESQQSIAAPR